MFRNACFWSVLLLILHESATHGDASKHGAAALLSKRISNDHVLPNHLAYLLRYIPTAQDEQNITAMPTVTVTFGNSTVAEHELLATTTSMPKTKYPMRSKYTPRTQNKLKFTSTLTESPKTEAIPQRKISSTGYELLVTTTPTLDTNGSIGAKHIHSTQHDLKTTSMKTESITAEGISQSTTTVSTTADITTPEYTPNAQNGLWVTSTSIESNTIRGTSGRTLHFNEPELLKTTGPIPTISDIIGSEYMHPTQYELKISSTPTEIVTTEETLRINISSTDPELQVNFPPVLTTSDFIESKYIHTAQKDLKTTSALAESATARGSPRKNIFTTTSVPNTSKNLYHVEPTATATSAASTETAYKLAFPYGHNRGLPNSPVDLPREILSNIAIVAPNEKLKGQIPTNPPTDNNLILRVPDATNRRSPDKRTRDQSFPRWPRYDIVQSGVTGSPGSVALDDAESLEQTDPVFCLGYCRGTFRAALASQDIYRFDNLESQMEDAAAEAGYNVIFRLRKISGAHVDGGFELKSGSVPRTFSALEEGLIQVLQNDIQNLDVIAIKMSLEPENLEEDTDILNDKDISSDGHLNLPILPILGLLALALAVPMTVWCCRRYDKCYRPRKPSR